jgi:acyl-CoA synthetase (NDP forming)
VTRAEDVGREIVAAIKTNNITKPMLSVFLSADAAPEVLREANIPSYRFPETAAIALARATRYGR